MKSRILLALACIWLLTSGLANAADDTRELIGTWDYASLTIASGATVHFKPGQWTLKLNADATWVMQGPTPNSKPVNGTYEVRAHKLKMNGGNDLEYDFRLKHGGKDLELKGKGTKISASRE